MSVEYKDTGWQTFIRTASALGTVRIKVGIVGPKASEMHGDSGLTNGEIAAFNEFGTKHVPERPAFRETFRDNRNAVGNRLADMVRRVIATGPAGIRSSLDYFGEWAVERVKHKIADHIPPPNAANTVRRKGSALPLVDTYQLMHAITHEITHSTGMLDEDHESFDVSGSLNGASEGGGGEGGGGGRGGGRGGGGRGGE